MLRHIKINITECFGVYRYASMYYLFSRLTLITLSGTCLKRLQAEITMSESTVCLFIPSLIIAVLECSRHILA